MASAWKPIEIWLVSTSESSSLPYAPRFPPPLCLPQDGWRANEGGRFRASACLDAARTVTTYRNGAEVPSDWRGAYVHFRQASPGEELTVTHPLIQFEQHVVLGMEGHDTGEFCLRWLGNACLEMTPRGKYLPMYAGSRREHA